MQQKVLYSIRNMIIKKNCTQKKVSKNDTLEKNYRCICMAYHCVGHSTALHVHRKGLLQARHTYAHPRGRGLQWCVVVVVREVIGLLFNDLSCQEVINAKGLLVR